MHKFEEIEMVAKKQMIKIDSGRTLSPFDFDGSVASAMEMLESINTEYGGKAHLDYDADAPHTNYGAFYVYGYREETDEEFENRKKKERKLRAEKAKLKVENAAKQLERDRKEFERLSAIFKEKNQPWK